MDNSGWSNDGLLAGEGGYSLGLAEGSSKGNFALYVNEPETGRDCWLYTGTGTVGRPPRWFGGNVFPNAEGQSGTYRIIANIKGQGAADFYIW